MAAVAGLVGSMDDWPGVGNKSDACATDACKSAPIMTGSYNIAIGYDAMRALGVSKTAPKPKLSVRYVRYRAAGVRSNAYKRLRHETVAIAGHYTHGKLMRAKQAIFVHRKGWDRQMVYGTSRMVRAWAGYSDTAIAAQHDSSVGAVCTTASIMAYLKQIVASSGITVEEAGRGLRLVA